MKYAPKKVFVLEGGQYIEISYDELQYRTENQNEYKEKVFIPLHGMLMEVSKEEYKAFYKNARRQKYLNELSIENGDISYDMLTTDEFIGRDILVAEKTDVSELVENKIMVDKLRECISLLSDDEKELVTALFFNGFTEREYAKKKGVYHNAIHKKKLRILSKLKKLLEN